MNCSMPIIYEAADDLKHRLYQERDRRKRQRLHLLYLVASGLRITVGRPPRCSTSGATLSAAGSLYAQGGEDALLDIYIPARKAPALTPDKLALLQQRLEQPEGFASYGEIQQWIATTLGVEMGYHAVHTLVYDTLVARPKVVRPREKSDEAVTAFLETFVERLESQVPIERRTQVEV